MLSLESLRNAKLEQKEKMDTDISEFSQKIKKMFQDADSKGGGTISRAVLARVFRELDSSWTSEDLDEMLALVGGNGGQDIGYAEFVDWFMEEEDPKLQKQLWQRMSNAFSTCEAEEMDDPDGSDSEADKLEEEEELVDLDMDLDETISLEVWTAVMGHLDMDPDEAKDIYDEVAEEFEERGEEVPTKGFPLREFLEELKIEPNDREGLEQLKEALELSKKEITAGAVVAEKPIADKATTRTMFDKVVRTLDLLQRPAEDAWQLVSDGKVRLSKAELSIFENWPGGQGAFLDKVTKFMASPPSVNATAGQVVCKQQCIAEVQRIIKECEESGKKFEDPDWNATSQENEVLYVDKRKPGYDCTVGTPVRWKRLLDIVKNSGSSTNSALGSLFGGFAARGSKKKVRPQLFKGGVKAGDIIQGNIGTCFLLGAMGAMASNKEEAIQRMFIKYDVDVGVYGVRFNLNGEWVYVIIDDFLPVDGNGNILYAQSKDPQEVWVSLLEKAYCKFHTCFEMCDGGQSAEAINAMLGGVGSRFLVKRKHRRNPGTYFKVLQKAFKKGWFLTSGFVPRGASAGAGKCGEAVLPTGLVGGHAYSIVKIVEAHGQQLVCCRNPWGSGEWTGKWSDENAEGEWTEQMKAATGYKGLDDGKFWMSIEDFVANTSGVEYARCFGPNWKKVTQYQHFRKKPTLANALFDYTARDDHEISFREGDVIEVSKFTGDWYTGNVKGKGKEGFFPNNYVKLKDRPVACFELSGTPDGGPKPMKAVLLLLQPRSHMKRRWYRRKQDGMNYKDLSYPNVQLVVVGPDGSINVKKEGTKRCIWGEVDMQSGGTWRVYALSTDGDGDMFTVRAYYKHGKATFTEVPDASLDDLISKI